MTLIQAYHRPHTLDDALTLLARPGLNTAVLAGGTYLTAHAEGVDEVIDLQALNLTGVAREGDQLTLGAMTTLQAVVDAASAPALLREMAGREGPNTFRNQGTVGGAIAGADPESEFLAALLALEAELTIAAPAGDRTLPLAGFLAEGRNALDGGILTWVNLAAGGVTASERVARTPADRPIVAAVGRKTPDGRVLLALCGVASTPILVDPDQVAALDPPADFRGSSEYRRQMAALLAGRVLSRLNS